MSKKNTFDHLKAAKKTVEAGSNPVKFRTLSVRLDLADARRFKSAADNNGLTNQAALVEAINRLMIEWSESPVADVGSTGKGRNNN